MITAQYGGDVFQAREATIGERIKQMVAQGTLVEQMPNGMKGKGKGGDGKGMNMKGKGQGKQGQTKGGKNLPVQNMTWT